LRATFFPYFLLAFCIPVSALLEPLTFPLRVVVTKVAVFICNSLLSMKVRTEGTLIFNAARTFQFDVAPACSGIHSVTAMFLLTLTFGFLNFVTAWRRAALLLAAIPIAVFCNIIRLVVVVMVGEGISEAAATKIETKFGFGTFLLGLACVFLLGRLLRERGPETAVAPEEITPRRESE
jgi:exosortase